MRISPVLVRLHVSSLQGSKWTYVTAIILFGVCNIITLWCAGYTVYLAVPHTLEGWKDFGE